MAKIDKEYLAEEALKKGVKRLGGLSLKLVTSFVTGLPDRLCLLPGGRLFFVELKAKGKSPRRIQRVIHHKIRKLGFEVVVLDSPLAVKEYLKEYATS